MLRADALDGACPVCALRDALLFPDEGSEVGVTERAGDRIGPYNHALKVVPMAECQAADIGDVPMQSRFSLEQCHADIEAFFRVLGGGTC